MSTTRARVFPDTPALEIRLHSPPIFAAFLVFIKNAQLLVRNFFLRHCVRSVGLSYRSLSYTVNGQAEIQIPAIEISNVNSYREQELAY